MAGYMAQAKRADWRTPAEVVELLHVLWEGGPDLDPCASTEAPVGELLGKVNLFGKPGMGDGLAEPWQGRVFVNPEFGDLAAWMVKAVQEHELHGAEVVVLLPARTDTRYWHEQVAQADAICFWRGRMTFVGAPAAAPFPTALVYFGPRPWDFQRVFASKGMVVCP